MPEKSGIDGPMDNHDMEANEMLVIRICSDQGFPSEFPLAHLMIHLL